jgi:hypothetical protein
LFVMFAIFVQVKPWELISCGMFIIKLFNGNHGMEEELGNDLPVCSHVENFHKMCYKMD